MNTFDIVIPDHVYFSHLKLAYEPDGSICFDWAPIEVICQASGIDISLFRDTPEENVSALIAGWYFEHLHEGGEIDPVEEDLISEVVLEDAHGGGISHPPGLA
jgi:hypothetical protein